MDSSFADVGLYPSITIGNDFLPVISYSDFTNNRIKIAKCGEFDCTAGNTFTFYSNQNAQDTSITIGLDGFPMISFYNATGDNLIFVKCLDQNCTSAFRRDLDTDGNVGISSSLVIGADGLPVISYNVIDNGFLRVAKCGSNYCASFATRR